jgi:hypothetical protein
MRTRPKRDEQVCFKDKTDDNDPEPKQGRDYCTVPYKGRNMPRFYFNLRTSKEFLEDAEGQEYETITAAREEAILSAREILSSRVSSGKFPNSSRFEIMDESGRLVLTVPFQDAYTVD